ncbi:MAG: peptidylprolyl isomerase [Caldilineaceae bacterium]|nr:peptidylprolyl isomerase [Caldilineaceae bacterium]
MTVISKAHIPGRGKSILVAAALTIFLLVLAACAAPQQAATPTAAVAPTAPAAEEVLANTGIADEVAARNNKYDAAPEMTIDESKYYYATLKTEQGDFKVQLFADRAPKTVNNFVFLARDGFYDNTTFHRVLDGFMAQAGDPTGTGIGGPGYEFEDEFYPGATFDRPGLLAMANAGPNTNGSQFFITFAPTPWLDGQHTIFGEVIEGQEVLDKLTRRDPQQGPSGAGDTLYAVEIEETESSILPTPTALPPTPTPFAPSSVQDVERPLAALSGDEKVNYFNTAPELVIDTSKRYTATIRTSQGDMVVELYDDAAPAAVNNFVVLANLGFYDNTPVNDVNPGLLVVIGAPNNDPTRDAGYLIQPEVGLPTEPITGSVTYRSLQQLPDGTVLASSSQLFLALSPPPAEAIPAYSFFGTIIEGVEILSTITVSDTIESITIRESE